MNNKWYESLSKANIHILYECIKTYTLSKRNVVKNENTTYF